MKITIEGEPEEIAALERELKGNKAQQIFNTYNSTVSPAEIARQARKSVSNMIRRR
jgi:hypothetical protein